MDTHGLPELPFEHLKHLFRKLDVPNRREAVRRGRELGLINWTSLERRVTHPAVTGVSRSTSGRWGDEPDRRIFKSKSGTSASEWRTRR